MNGKASTVRPMTRFGVFSGLSFFVLALSLGFASKAWAETACEGFSQTYTANVVALDSPMVFNRLGAQNPNFAIYALKRDVVTTAEINGVAAGTPLTDPGLQDPDNAGFVRAGVAGNVALRADKRPRPLVLRLPRCSKLEVNFQNLLAADANPVMNANDLDQLLEDRGLECVNNNDGGCPVAENGPPLFPFGGPPVIGNDQVKTRYAGVHVQGLQLAADGGIANDASWVGNNANSCVGSGGSTGYKLLAEHEGGFLLSNPCAATGGEATGGNNGLGMFGVVAVQPKGARIYRSQVYEEEYRLAADANLDGVIGVGEKTAAGQPILDYEAIYPNQAPWTLEGKAQLPVLNMICNAAAVAAGACTANEIVHSEINAIVAGPNADGTFPTSTYPLEAASNGDIRNPAYPTRLQAFRDFASIFHDETAATQAFEGFFARVLADGSPNPVAHTLHGVRDSFMINYGSGGIGSEIIANRLGVGPMYDCLGCAYEEFFLTSFTVGDPAVRVDVPANFGLENVSPETVAGSPAALVPWIGPKATTALFQDDPANIHNGYTGDFTKVRNVHAGPKEQHIYHQHNHQWLFNANDDRANYLDAQGIGPGSSYTYEYVYGGLGNRNKTAGDAIFHCHFYPHFAQGMWYHMRIYDTAETGTILAASVTDGAVNNYHNDPFELGNSPPALVTDTYAAGLTSFNPAGLPANARNRAHPDGEILAGIPISAVVPLPGKPMPLMPEADVVIVTKNVDPGKDNVPDDPGCEAVPAGPTCGVQDLPDASQAHVIRPPSGPVGNPGYPFWIAGVDCGNDLVNCEQGNVGQRPTTPPLDMLTQAQADDLLGNTAADPDGDGLPGDAFYTALVAADTTGQFATAFVNAAGGFDGGLPRHAIGGCKAAGTVNVDDPATPVNEEAVFSCTAAPTVHGVGPIFESAETRLDFHKEVMTAKGVLYPEEGTDLEKAAMGYHAERDHPSTAVLLSKTAGVIDTAAGDFVSNGLPPVPGAPYQDPCVSDTGQPLLASANPDFFAANGFFNGASAIQDGRDWDSPFTYAAANIQIDAVFNKVGYHYPQQRIIALWGDVLPTINKQKAPEPFVMRLNSFNCAKYQHSNLVPKEFEVDDYQVRTPTDIIGQHIHLPKWDLTTADGAANGWNYEDGTLSPGMVVERIHAINNFNDALEDNGLPRQVAALTEQAHPALGPGVGGEWLGSRVTLQRWFADPLVDRDGVDRGLGIVFTHDHYGPSTFQQIGLYSTLLAQPAKSTWLHNETGVTLGSRQSNCGDPSLSCDGGPTSWQAAIVDIPDIAVNSGATTPFREFYFEFSDFQQAYEAGVYVGAGPDGRPFDTGPTPGDCDHAHDPDCHNGGGVNQAFPVTDDTFRHAINPSFRQQAICKPGAGALPECTAGSPFPDIVRFPSLCPDGSMRPCPEAINADDAGMLVANYRNEPIGLRVFDPVALGPDGQPGTQAASRAGDLAFALQSRNDRAIFEMNRQPAAGDTLEVGGMSLNGVDPFYAPDECSGGGCTILPTAFPPPINAGGVQNSDPFTPMLRVREGDLVKIKVQSGAHEHEHNVGIHGVKWVQGNSGHGPQRPAGGWRNAQNIGISEQFNFAMPVIADDNQAGNVADYAYSVDTSQDGWWTGMWGIMRSYGTPQADLHELSGGSSGLTIRNPGDFNGVCPTTAPVRHYDVVAVLANEALGNALGVTVSNGKNGAAELTDAADELHVGGPLNAAGGTLVYNPRGGSDGTGVAQYGGALHDPTGMMYVLLQDLEPRLVAGVSPDLVGNGDPATAGDSGPDGIDDRCQEPSGSTDPLDDPFDLNLALEGCPVQLKANAPVEPLTLRAQAGECIDVTLINKLIDQAVVAGNLVFSCQTVMDPDTGLPVCDPSTLTPLFELEEAQDALDQGLWLVQQDGTPVALNDVVFDSVPDLAGFNTLLQMVLRDRQAQPGNITVLTGAGNVQMAEVAASVTTFQNNLIRPSAHIGLHPQMVEYDVTRSDGTVVGINNVTTVAPGGSNTYRWYAGDLQFDLTTLRRGRARLRANAVEFGGSNLMPADKIKQGQKGMVGALVVEPQGAAWANSDGAAADDLALLEQVPNRQTGGVDDPATADVDESVRGTRADMVVSANGTTFDDLVLVKQSGLNHRYFDGEAVPNIASEGQGIPEDAHDAGQKGVNYGSEPAWFRFGLPADVDFGNALAGLGAVNAEEMFANARTGGDDPWTPVFTATPGQQARMRVLQPTGVGRGSTFDLHGHVWARDPYLPETPGCLTATSGLGNGTPLNAGGSGCGLSSVAIGPNPLAWYLGGQESWTPGAHFDMVLPSAGGADAVTGDYLFRDHASFGVTDGIWGIMRVAAAVEGGGSPPPPPPPPAANELPVADANGPYNGRRNRNVSFSSAGSNDPDGSIVGCRWDFGDGTVVDNGCQNLKHSYSRKKTYTVTLTVTDDKGATGSDTTTAKIR